MFNKEMYELGCKRSKIRELYEYGKLRSEQFGADSVFDFSLGNPNVAPPDSVNDALKEIINSSDVSLHGYTSAQGDFNVRKTVAQKLSMTCAEFAANTSFTTCNYSADNIYMTCGAASGLAITLRALCEKGDEFILLAPCFPEYEVFVKSAGGSHITVPFTDGFQIDLDALKTAITPHTKAVIVNSPNNPSGIVYSQKTIEKLAEILAEFEREYFHPIYIISDEPYRELVYDRTIVPFIPSVYGDTIICYSFSKSLSLAGERIGYIAINPNSQCAKEIYCSILGAGRALGYVCAPALFQQVIAKCIDASPRIDQYAENRDLLYNGLTKMGYECARPDGAFYLFVKAIGGDSVAFCDRAKEYGLLIVNGDDFAAQGWARIAYCVDKEMIVRALPQFQSLYDSYIHHAK